MALNVTNFQFQCVKTVRSKDTIDDLCTYPKQFCDGVLGICRNCLNVCKEERIPRACLDTCKGQLTKNVTTTPMETISEIDCTADRWISHEAWFFMTLFLGIVLAVTVVMWFTQRHKYRLQIKQALAGLPLKPVQETSPYHTTGIVPRPEMCTLLNNTGTFVTDETTMRC